MWKYVLGLLLVFTSLVNGQAVWQSLLPAGASLENGVYFPPYTDATVPAQISASFTDSTGKTFSFTRSFTIKQSTPLIAVSTSSINFGGTASTLTAEVWNAGGETLSWHLVNNTAWVTTDIVSGTSYHGSKTTITFTTHRDLIPPNPDRPVISVDTNNLVFAPDETQKTLDVWNSGGKPLDLHIDVGVPWLSVTPDNITLQPLQHQLLTFTTDYSQITGPGGTTITTNVNLFDPTVVTATGDIQIVSDSASVPALVFKMSNRDKVRMVRAR